MLRFGTEEGPGEPTESPSVPDMENAVPEDVQDSAVQNTESLGPIFGVILNMAIGVLSGLVLTALIALGVRVMLRTRPRMRTHLKIVLVPAFTAMGFLGARVGLGLSGRDFVLFELLAFLTLIGTVAGFAWLALRVVNVVQRRVELRYEESTTEDRRGRRIKTQMQLIKRVLSTIIVVIAISAILLTFPQVRALGAGLLASAGLVSVVAALAVQTTLTNVFAGIQLAFTDAIRVGDVVVMDDYYGTIEDITMSYVVLKIWDGRRIIYPSSYFTNTPFENYTRVGTEISAGIDFELDWRVPVDALRARLRALVESSDLWDGRDLSIQVLDIAGDRATLRAAVSARNAGELWDLQCLVREDMIRFVSEEHPMAMNVMRIENLPAGPAPEIEAPEATRGTTTESKKSKSQSRTPWDLGAVPEVDTGKVRSRRGSEPPVERGWIPTVQKETDDGLKETGPDTSSVPLTQPSEDGSMYTGSVAAIERGADMAGPGEEAYRERLQNTDELDVQDGDDTQDEQKTDQTQEFERVREDEAPRKD